MKHLQEMLHMHAYMHTVGFHLTRQKGVTLNNASDYRTKGLYWTPNLTLVH